MFTVPPLFALSLPCGARYQGDIGRQSPGYGSPAIGGAWQIIEPIGISHATACRGFDEDGHHACVGPSPWQVQRRPVPPGQSVILRQSIVSDFQKFFLTARPNQFFNPRRLIPR
jgi:hypothetical protein